MLFYQCVCAVYLCVNVLEEARNSSHHNNNDTAARVFYLMHLHCFATEWIGELSERRLEQMTSRLHYIICNSGSGCSSVVYIQSVFTNDLTRKPMCDASRRRKHTLHSFIQAYKMRKIMVIIVRWRIIVSYILSLNVFYIYIDECVSVCGACVVLQIVSKRIEIIEEKPFVLVQLYNLL